MSSLTAEPVVLSGRARKEEQRVRPGLEAARGPGRTAKQGGPGTVRRALVVLGAVLVLVAVVAFALIAEGPLGGLYQVYLFPAVGVLYALAGLVAWWRRPANRLGALLTACGALWLATSLANTAVPTLIAVGLVTATLPASVMLHLVLACPSGDVRGVAGRATVGACYFIGLVLQVPLWAFAPEPPPFDVLLVSPRPDLFRIGADVQRSVGAVVVVAVLWLLVQRLQRYGTAERRLLGSLLGYSVVAVLSIPLGGDVLEALGLGNDAIAIQLGMVAVVPLGFLAVVLRGGFAPPGELSALVEAVATPDDGEPDLDRAVAAALGDPSAAVLHWADGEWRDSAARPWPAHAHLATVTVSAGGRPVGAVVHDRELGSDHASLRAVAQVVGIALERQRLARELAESRSELQDASRRVLASADEERRRIARDLHDGLQGALVRLALQARSEDSSSLANGIDAAAVALRRLVDGLLPVELADRGVAAAVRELTDGFPLPVVLEVSGLQERLDAAAEATIWFVVAEGLTNVLKHARASCALVRLEVVGSSVQVEVADDGAGLGDPVAESGLLGLRDRLAVLGGVLEIGAGSSGGTRLVASVPCG